jgi:Icc-related predicted phosphoesterase
MRVTVISDLHGASEHLAAVSRECDVLVVLGDLINVLDYRTMDGILVRVFGREPVAEAAALRARGRVAEARKALRRGTPDEGEARARFAQLAREEYARVLEALPVGSIVTYGNVDIPDLLASMVPGGVRFVDGEVIELAGLRWGIAGGGAATPVGAPGEIADGEFAAKLDRMGSVDVVGTHAPPRIPWFCYDVVAERFEPGSAALVAYIAAHRPRYALFGHVHQPLVDRGMVGSTELVNVGHFRAHGRGWQLEGPD